MTTHAINPNTIALTGDLFNHMKNKAIASYQNNLALEVKQDGLQLVEGYKQELLDQGFSNTDIKTFLGYDSENVVLTENQKVIGSALRTTEKVTALENILSVTRGLSSTENFDKKEYMATLKEQIDEAKTVPLTKDGKPDQQYSNMFTQATDWTGYESSRTSLEGVIKTTGKLLTIALAAGIAGGCVGPNDPDPNPNPNPVDNDVTVNFHAYNTNGQRIEMDLFLNGESKGLIPGNNGLAVTLEKDKNYSLKGMGDNTHMAWLLVRENLNGKNIDQKDAVDRDASIKGKNGDIYLIKIPDTWDMESHAEILERRPHDADPAKKGMYALDLKQEQRTDENGNTYMANLPVLVQYNEEGMVGSDYAKSLVLDNMTQTNEAQMRGEFGARQYHQLKTDSDTEDARIDIRFLDIPSNGARHGEFVDETTKEITSFYNKLAGTVEHSKFMTTFQEWFEAHVHKQLDSLLYDGSFINKTQNGDGNDVFSYTDKTKQLIMLNSHFDPNTRYVGGTNITE